MTTPMNDIEFQTNRFAELSDGEHYAVDGGNIFVDLTIFALIAGGAITCYVGVYTGNGKVFAYGADILALGFSINTQIYY